MPQVQVPAQYQVVIVVDLEQELADRLRSLEGFNTVIVGIGNELKGDDGVGPYLCHLLKDKVTAKLIDAGTVPENYIQPIIKARSEKLLIVDAVDFGGQAGQARIFEPKDISSVVMSTHSLSPRLFIDLIEREVETEVLFLGIQPVQMQLGQGLSPDVQSTAEQIAEILIPIFQNH